MYNNKHIFKNLKEAITILLLTISFAGLSQENPWESKPKGENPWSTEETNEVKETKAEPIKSTKVVVFNADSVSTASKEKFDVAGRSTNTIRYFNMNDSIVKLNTNSYDYLKQLNRHGRSIHKANGALGGGIFTASFISIMAVPLNLITSVVPTNQINYKISQFKKDNPHATKKEIRAVRIGINGKRFAKSMGGIGIGCLINIVAVLVIFA